MRNLPVTRIRTILLLALLAFRMPAVAQGEFNNWFFGQMAGLTFNSGTPQQLTGNVMTAGRGPISVSDSAGNLLFYSDGIKVWNRNNLVMPNGDNLIGNNSWDQCVAVVPNPADDSIYYVFTYNYGWLPFISYGGLHYSVVDMRLDGGLGDIPPGQKNIQLQTFNDYPMNITTARHKNNHDAWVITKNTLTSNDYSAFQVTDAGVSPVPVISPSSWIGSHYPYGNPGTMRVSPDGTMLLYPYLDTVEVSHFDPGTGVVTPAFFFQVGPDPIHKTYSWHYMAFSPDSRYLYCSTGDWNWNGSLIFQYDVSVMDSLLIRQSETLVGSLPHGCYLQTGPDGKIYGTVNGKDSLCVINNPNLPGAASGFQDNAIWLHGKLSYQGLPDLIPRYFVYIRDSLHCQGTPAWFSASVWTPADSLHWDFGDPSSGPSNYSNATAPGHVYALPGVYPVKLFVRHIDHRTDSTLRTITIDPGPVPLLGPDRTICPGDSVLLDAGACAGCTYQWTNLTTGLPVGNSQTYMAKQAGIFEVAVSNTGNCTGRDTVAVVVQPPVPVTATITANPGTTVCQGTCITFTASAANPGSSPAYAWKVNGLPVGTNASTYTYCPVSNDSVYCIITSSLACTLGNPDTSNVIHITIDPGLPVSVSISASANPVCPGSSVAFTAMAINGGSAPSYSWRRNGIPDGSNISTFTFIPLAGDQVQCILTSSLTSCLLDNPDTSNTITMSLLPNSPVSVAIAASANPVCQGTPVIFTATAVNPGLAPVFTWKVNGVTAGSNSSTYSYIPVTGDVITCTLMSNEVCAINNPAISNPVVMTVSPNLPVSISVAASSNPFCLGNTVVFTATAGNGGTAPIYTWKVNGVTAGASSSTYSYIPVTGDIVTCIVMSNEVCATGNPAISAPITMTGFAGVPASVSISATPSPSCPGVLVTFTASPTNGGTVPIYAWKVNGAPVGSNNPSYSYFPASGDLVSVIMTSNLACVSNNPASSIPYPVSLLPNPLVTFVPCFDTITTTNAKPIKLKGGIPIGGTYSGPGVTANIFNPSLAGSGTKTISYSYTNSALCSSSATARIFNFQFSIFNCGNNLTDLRDNQSYPTVQIGTQCWMAENLDYGTQIPETMHQRDNCVAEKYVLTSIVPRPSFYQWDELMRYDDTPGLQGLCPPGWHVPTEAEWTTLLNYLGGPGFAGSALLSSGFSGFNAQTSGIRHLVSQWDFNGFATFFWSSTPDGTARAWAHGMNNVPDDHSVSWYPAVRSNGFAVRCIKD
jgi:uncharacterized protein (TIGR02145 family)